MGTMAGEGRWLGRELLLRLMTPVLAIVVATAALGGWGAHRLTEQVFDHWLLDNARSLVPLLHPVPGNRVALDLPPQAESVLLHDDVDRGWFGVSQAGRLMGGTAGLPVQGSQAAHYFNGVAYNAFVGGVPVRVARVDVDLGAGAPVVVLAAETCQKRQTAEGELLLMMWPMAVLIAATALAILHAVRRSVQPLQALSVRWQERPQASLEAFDARAMPRELMPFANALNALLARIRAMLARERQFAATAAHQLRTPLTGLQLGLARAAEQPDLAAMRAVVLETSHATQRTARLVQQLLTVGHLDPEAQGDLDLRDTDLVALAGDVGAAHADLAVARGVELELIAVRQPVRAQVQPALIAEALGNLIDNAIRYTPPGGRVCIEFDADPPAVRVIDSGPGIPVEEREAVMERFVRGRHASGDGSGLGLAIVRDIAELHGAQVVLCDSPLGGTEAGLHFERMPKR